MSIVTFCSYEILIQDRKPAIAGFLILFKWLSGYKLHQTWGLEYTPYDLVC